MNKEEFYKLAKEYCAKKYPWFLEKLPSPEEEDLNKTPEQYVEDSEEGYQDFLSDE